MHYKISVCIPTYNGEKYIGEQLESILKQLDMQDEVIISDDNSTDHTLEVVRRLNDNRIRIYQSFQRAQSVSERIQKYLLCI